MDSFQTILVSLLNGGAFYLPIHIAVFVLLPLILRIAYAHRYRIDVEPSNTCYSISVVVPEHNESCKVFEECLKSIVENDPLEIIVVLDDGRREIAEIAERYGAKVVAIQHRVGKRNSMVIGWRMAKGDIIVHVDSDVILWKNALREIVKPFNDELVVAVQGRIHVRRSKSWLAWRLSQIIELNRDMACRALNGHLIVVDGRFNAWRRRWLLEHASEFCNEKFLERRCEVGDDRFLTLKANAEGYRTAYQSTACAETLSPPTMRAFLKQQLRWMRGGLRAFLNEVRSGFIVKAPFAYSFLEASYYLGPVALLAGSFVTAILLASLEKVVPLATAIALLLALVSIVLARRTLRPYEMTLRTFITSCILMGLLTYPLTLLSLFTVHKQDAWLTR